ncbi:copper-binding protein [Rariglobus hedericola]|uniref:copper-binding protein n=1 Tax=Rariglobus hedericola TaxID=2597822 RepID=UPI0013967B66|nr:copper-binding protein [Rariglobus hedericola]
MQSRPLFLLLGLLTAASGVRAATDSPTFVVHNQLVAVPASTSASTRTETDARARVTLTDGRELTVWLAGEELLFDLTKGASYVLDPHATAGCPPVLVAFADNSALLVWRGRGEGDTRDLRTARFADGAWQPATTLNQDDWRTLDDPVGEGPAIDSRGSHVAVAWFTAAEGPRINVATSSNAGSQWLIPLRVDDIAPIGRVSIVLLDDGAQLVSWVERLETDYVILLRRISPQGTLSVPVQLARLAPDPGHPRLTRIKDGDTTPAQLRLAYTVSGQPVARLITLPDASLLAEADTCGCDPRPEDQRGYALKGRITDINPKAGTITLSHDDIPGLLKATTTIFKAAPDMITAAKPNSRVFARTERIGPDLWLFNVRTLVTP